VPKLLNIKFPEGRYILNCDNTELKRFPKIFFSISVMVSLGVSGLKYHDTNCDRDVLGLMWKIDLLHFIQISQRKNAQNILKEIFFMSVLLARLC